MFRISVLHIMEIYYMRTTMFVITKDIAFILMSRKILEVVLVPKQLLRMHELLRLRKRNLYFNAFFNDAHTYLYVYVYLESGRVSRENCKIYFSRMHSVKSLQLLTLNDL